MVTNAGAERIRPSAVEAEDGLSARTFGRIADFLYRKTGILVRDYKRYLVINRLARFVGPGKAYPGFDALASALEAGRDEGLLADFINALTTNFSYFFRDPVHFEVLSRYLVEKGPDQEYLRLWSAAASTGEEAYGMAMTVAESPAPLPRDVKILATDISTKVLDAATAGTYRYEQLKKGMDDAAIKRHFARAGESGHFVAREALRGMIAFRYLNLLSDYPFRKSMDVVFLRNVLIYFGTKEKEEVLRRIGEVLKPGGLLLVGLSESLVGVRHDFKMQRNSIYAKE